MALQAETETPTGHRERLLEAAVVCLGRQGYARTTARDLVAESGTNLGSIGYHFGSKERLLDEALALALRRWFDPLIELGRAPADASLLERLELGLRAFVASLERNRMLVTARYEALAQVERSEELRAAMRENLARSRAAIAELITSEAGPQELERRGVDAESVAATVISLIDGLILQWYVDPERMSDPDELVGSVSAMLPILFDRR